MNLEPTKETQKQQLAELVRAAQSGDREAFEQLFTRYQRVVYAAVFQRLGNHAEAQEVCQEVLIQAMRKIDQLENPLCFGAWLRAIAGRMAINRAVRRGPVVAAEADQFEARCVESETPLGRMLAQEREDQLHLGLKRLTDLDRNTLEAFYFRGQSLVEMSDEFQSPVGTIKRRLHVARKRLAKELEALAPA
ncbi:MAG: sigma-70 family RNA polymerase sigma factor [Pirellulales bacterium]|nr:sigma-70 family RNA polymerase sigma factor [Pirellulales bacterium]